MAVEFETMKHRTLRIEPLENRSMLSVTLAPGTYHEQFKPSNPSGLVELQGAVFLGGEGPAIQINGPYVKHGADELPSGERYPVAIDGNQQVWIDGGRVLGQQSSLLKWHDEKRANDGDAYHVDVAAPWELRNFYVNNVEDGVGTINGTFDIHDGFLDHIRDDAIENDANRSGTVRDLLVRGQTFYSDRGVANPNTLVTFDNVLVELILQPHAGHLSPDDINTAGGYPYPDGLGSGYFFKMMGADSGTIEVRNSSFLMPRNPTSSDSAADFPPGVYENVTVYWMGQGAYPGQLQPGITLINGDRTAFDAKVSQFFAAHPQFAEPSSVALVASGLLSFAAVWCGRRIRGAMTSPRPLQYDMSPLL